MERWPRKTKFPHTLEWGKLKTRGICLQAKYCSFNTVRGQDQGWCASPKSVATPDHPRVGQGGDTSMYWTQRSDVVNLSRAQHSGLGGWWPGGAMLGASSMNRDHCVLNRCTKGIQELFSVPTSLLTSVWAQNAAVRLGFLDTEPENALQSLSLMGSGFK